MTTAAVPSTDAVDFLLNVQSLDSAVNSSSPTFTDRLGNVRMTVAGSIAEFPNAAAHDASASISASAALISESNAASSASYALISENNSAASEAASGISASSATSSAGLAAASQSSALSAKSAAETARDAAQLSAGVYASTAAGLAATTTGNYFNVVSGVAAEYLILYLNNAGSAVEQKRYPSITAFVNPRITSLSDSPVRRVNMPAGGVFLGGAGDTTGAFKIKLPVGAPRNNIILDITIMDNYGFLNFQISGINNSPSWNYVRATVVGQHSLRQQPNIRWGNDGTGDCIWIGDTTYTYWAYPQIWINKVLVAGSGSEAHTSGWVISRVTAFDTVTAGPTIPTRGMSTENPVFTGTLNDGTVNFPFAAAGTHLGYHAGQNSVGSGTYNTFVGYEAGALVTSGYNNTFIGMQSGAEATTGFANSANGIQTLQHLTTGSFNAAMSIHALQGLTTGVANNAFGAGAMEYLTAGSNNNAMGMYAGRDTQGSGNLFLGHHAGITSNASDELWISNSDTQNLIRGHFVNNRLWVGGGVDDGVNTFQINGPLRFKPAAVSTPLNVGDLTFEATSNTSLKVKFMGSDAVVRSVTFAIA